MSELEPLQEFNFDGLIGPTHNYSGLSYGNVASDSHRHQTAFPRAAALQGLAKMKRLADLGIGQAILPPLRRPRTEFLETLGLSGDRQGMIQQALQLNPVLLATCYSASAMWTANAATVSPSADCGDQRLHLTVANLSSTLHRSIEHRQTCANLQFIFANDQHFRVHPALPSQPGFADEGAANHTRLCPAGFDSSSAGLELFAFGIDPLDSQSTAPKKFPARQTRLASESIARQHQLGSERVIVVQQNPVAIDAGVFHNDVISVGHQNVLLCHEQAFLNQAAVLELIAQRFEQQFGQPLHIVEISTAQLPLADAVASYLFNSQIVTRPDGGMTLVCPIECQEIESAFQSTQQIVSSDNPIDEVIFVDLRQSMNNGGGPACLRLRVALTKAQQAALHPGILFSESLYQSLTGWVQRHYREELHPDDLSDPQLPAEVDSAFAELETILHMPLA